MNKKNILTLIKITSILVIILCLQSCTTKDKSIILTNNMKEDIISEEDQILDLIHQGNTHLNSKNFDEAKNCYESAISKDITNESTYLEIKNKYIDAQRYDDAYYIIKLAIDNNVSRESMDGLLKDIQSHFSPTIMAISIHEGDEFILPSKVTIPINEINTEATIIWDKSKVDTSTAGTFNFEGYADEYGRKVNLSLKIIENPIAKPPTNSSLSGYIEDIYDKDGSTYIVFDEFQYFANPEEAQREYFKDYAMKSELAFGYNYYLRNPSEDTKTYKIQPNAIIKLCGYALNPESEDPVSLKETSIDGLKKHINKFKDIYNPTRMFKINLTNDVISEISMYYA